MSLNRGKGYASRRKFHESRVALCVAFSHKFLDTLQDVLGASAFWCCKPLRIFACRFPYPEADRQKATVKVEVKIRQPDLAMIKPEMSVES